MESIAYQLTPEPPLFATPAAHAATLKQVWYEVSPRTIDGWKTAKHMLNGKNQFYTIDVWATAASMYHDEDALEEALARLPAPMAQAVREATPDAGRRLEELKAARAAAARSRAA